MRRVRLLLLRARRALCKMSGFMAALPFCVYMGAITGVILSLYSSGADTSLFILFFGIHVVLLSFTAWRWGVL